MRTHRLHGGSYKDDTADAYKNLKWFVLRSSLHAYGSNSSMARLCLFVRRCLAVRGCQHLCQANTSQAPDVDIQFTYVPGAEVPPGPTAGRTYSSRCCRKDHLFLGSRLDRRCCIASNRKLDQPPQWANIDESLQASSAHSPTLPERSTGHQQPHAGSLGVCLTFEFSRVCGLDVPALQGLYDPPILQLVLNTLPRLKSVRVEALLSVDALVRDAASFGGDRAQLRQTIPPVAIFDPTAPRNLAAFSFRLRPCGTPPALVHSPLVHPRLSLSLYPYPCT